MKPRVNVDCRRCAGQGVRPPTNFERAECADCGVWLCPHKRAWRGGSFDVICSDRVTCERRRGLPKRKVKAQIGAWHALLSHAITGPVKTVCEQSIDLERLEVAGVAEDTNLGLLKCFRCVKTLSRMPTRRTVAAYARIVR